MQTTEEEVLKITRQMLDAMYTANSDIHRKHSAEDMSSYEWYIAPQRIDGPAFHVALIVCRSMGTRQLSITHS
jgi:hypothetical protein